MKRDGSRMFENRSVNAPVESRKLSSGAKAPFLEELTSGLKPRPPKERAGDVATGKKEWSRRGFVQAGAIAPARPAAPPGAGCPPGKDAPHPPPRPRPHESPTHRVPPAQSRPAAPRLPP